jgi:hypothetical protein
MPMIDHSTPRLAALDDFPRARALVTQEHGAASWSWERTSGRYAPARPGSPRLAEEGIPAFRPQAAPTTETMPVGDEARMIHAGGRHACDVPYD